MAERKHVAVLMGGWSAERPVSLWSGEGCAAALERAGYRVTRVDVQRRRPVDAGFLQEIPAGGAYGTNTIASNCGASGIQS